MSFNMQKLMKQAQKMQADMAKVQEELKAAEYEGTAGGGVVKAVVNGANQVLSVSIDPEAVDPEDIELLEDMVVAAVNDALTTAGNAAQQAMGKVTGGMGLPGMF